MVNDPFGSYFRSLRRAAGELTLREFCSRHGLDPGYISKMERGKSPPPPTAEKLADLASAVGVTPDSSEWSEFSARAFAARGEVPPDLTVDSNIVGKLPVLYRRLRGEQVDAEDLEDLIRLIRDA